MTQPEPADLHHLITGEHAISTSRRVGDLGLLIKLPWDDQA